MVRRLPPFFSFFVVVTIGAASTPMTSAAEIGFVEDFALAGDRTTALKQLIPGTEDHYYYHSLHYQNTQQFDKVDELLTQWIKRYNYTPRVNEILNRQVLLTYEKNPQRTLTRLREQLGLRFEHQRDPLNARPDLPTTLDPKLVSRQTLTQRALARYENLHGFEPEGLEIVAAADLNPVRRRDLLSRLARPDYPNLVKLVVDDLNHRDSGGFGSLAIHSQLLQKQLDECLAQKPELLNQQAFVSAYLVRLQPPVVVHWQQNPRALAQHLDRLQAFVERLGPVHNSLKAHVLFQRLQLDRSQGTFDRGRLLAYLKLPRPVVYVQPKLMELEESRHYPCNLRQDFRAQTLLPPVGNDEPLVRSYLAHFFVDAENYKDFLPYVQDVYLKELFAKTKIVHGRGDAEQWYSLLPPEKYQQLRERVDLDFAETNQLYFAPDAPVSMDLWVKNVETLIVKVFEINTTSFCRQRLTEVNTDVDLDGLVAHEEKTVTYQETPFARVQRHFEFPKLNKRGVYVVDFIGNGRNSRALIRKGRLRHLVRTSSAGHVFTILDENNKRLPEATLWLAGQEHKPDKDGQITVPFTATPRQQPIVLSYDGFSSLDHFQHEAENYTLAAGIHVDRESLVAGQTARVIVRPSLRVSGLPAALSLLEEVTLRIHSTDLDGVATSKTIPDFKVQADRESVFEFNVPPRTVSLIFTLDAKVQNLSQNKKNDLRAQKSLALNEIDRTDKTESLHLSNIDGRFVIDVLGKSGELRPDRTLQLSLKHRLFREPVQALLKSDAQGRVALGPLTDIVTIQATGQNGVTQVWNLPTDQHTYHREINALVGDTVSVPYLGALKRPDRSELSLLEMRSAYFAVDRFPALAIKDGLLTIEGLSAGDYQLLIKSQNTHIHIRVAAGERREGYVLGSERFLERRGSKPLTIASIEKGKEEVTIQLTNANLLTRVHVLAMRYEPAWPAFGDLSNVRDVEPLTRRLSTEPSAYLAGRNLGDEYRYIIDRKRAKKFPGNMLARPGLLLNPWARVSSESAEQLAQLSEALEGRGMGGRSTGARAAPYFSPNKPSATANLASLDFLDVPSAVLLNLQPDKDGVVRVPRKQLGPHQRVQVVAVDPLTTTSRSISLAETPRKQVALQLKSGLDPQQHFIQQKQISVVKPGEKFKVADVTSARYEVYDSLPRVYSLYTTLSGDAKLAEFSFILEWPKLKPEKQRELYSKYACHELNFYLLKKDPKFFTAVVKPYLANKKEKTFLDRWLLEEDLKDYMQPWNHARLNTVERILLAQRIAGETPRTTRHIGDLLDMMPPNIDLFNGQFRTALSGRGLEKQRFRNEAMPGKVMNPNGTQSDYYSAAEAPKSEPVQQLDQALEMSESVHQLANKHEVKEQHLAKTQKAVADRGRVLDAASDLKDDESQFTYGGWIGKDRDEKRRESVRQFFRQLDATQEWAENNYYNLPRQQQTAALVGVSGFWKDYAARDQKQAFYSTHLAEAARNFTEMMNALAVLDLPFEAAKHDTQLAERQLTLTAKSPLIVFHEQVLPTAKVAKAAPILVSENFFRADDRYRFEQNRRYDKYVSGEYVVHIVYGCQVVVTNPTSAPRLLDALLQIPAGTLSVNGGQPLKTVSMLLEPYQTKSLEYYFYFPAAGKFAHYPVQVSQEEELLASTEPTTLTVVAHPSQIDRASWDYISQHGTPQEVIAYLTANNLERTNLDRIAWRMREADYFRQVLALLTARHVYNNTLWSYSVLHSDVPAMREYLQHADGFVSQCGPMLASPLLTIDPVARGIYEHLEYRPLVNARAHQLGRRRQILNDRFFTQYHQLLTILSYQPSLSNDDLMAVTHYLLLQDRTEEALAFFQRVNAERLATRMQYDYCAAYLDVSSGKPELAAKIAAKHKDHSVDRWRNAFADVTAQTSDKNAGVVLVDPKDRDQQQTTLASQAAAFDFKIEDRKIALNYQNLASVDVRFYLLDIEVLFSNNPFVQTGGGAFSAVRPNMARTVKLDKDRQATTIDLPAELRNSNVLVEISGGGQTRSQAHCANSLIVQVSEPYGQLTVAQAEGPKPLSTVYVKVYARMKDGQVKFFKDGYTDHRGRFDYASLSTNELDNVSRLAVLVLSDQFGAVVREADPPKR